MNMSTTNASPNLQELLALLVFVTVLLASGHPASAAAPKDLPKPTDYVSDLAHVFSPRAIKEVDRVCTQLDHANDTQIAVVTIPSLDGEDIAEYAKELGNIWGVGRKETHRGVLILLAIKDRKWRIAVGYGLEGILTDAKTAEIGQDMTPELKANDYNDAVMLVVHEIAQAVLDAVPVSRSDSDSVGRRFMRETVANTAHCCNTTWSPSLRPETISVADPFESPTVTGTLRKPSFWCLSGICTEALRWLS